MSNFSPLSGISGLSFDFPVLSLLLFFCLVLLLFLFCHFLSSVEVTGHRHSAVTDSSIGSGASKRCCKHILCCCSSGTSGTVQFQMMGFI